MSIKTYVNDIAAQVGLFGLIISLGRKCQLNKIPIHVLSISTSAKKIEALVTHDEITDLQKGEIADYFKARMELFVRSLMN